LIMIFGHCVPIRNTFTIFIITITHFHQFFTVLEYSLTRVTFLQISAPCTLYTVKKINWKIFNTFFWCKTYVLKLFQKYI
jgi:hypothetical protein